MSRIVNESTIAIEDLVCPITLEVFRDPVVAQDGHAYEREAITKWILEHGTSPLTREPLEIDLLQADERLRQLCQQRRNSTVSYNARSQTITLPPSHKEPKVQSSSPMQITSQYSSSLKPNDSQFSRHFGTKNKAYYYKAVLLNASFSGSYQVKSISKIDLYGYLYSGYFVSKMPSVNLLQYDDDSGGNQQFLFDAWLTPDNYTLVVTTYSGNVTGPFSLAITGPGTVVFSIR
ncbi:unnamed protein product [Adineta ricciae]|uniref:U-box domain-containing protein n=1 Tax=Adineta ricciae TaxID=249248 RepID=A0A814PEU0_ADIRI|nr:unnamed protein product [Adineta ricciae]CAF1106899.1 unnamed protein product [Adineta ricciae]